MSFNVKDKDISITDLQQDLTSIRNWCLNNSLLINPDKTKLIVFGTKQMLSRLDDFKLSLLGKELTPCDSVRDLGVCLDPPSCPMTNIFQKQCLLAYLVFVK